jgi:exosortase/archaeosortase family protein
MKIRFHRRHPMPTFVLTFVVVYVLLAWVLGGAGPIPAVNTFIRRLTEVQAHLASGVLRLFAQKVSMMGTVIVGPVFSCDVAQGCNGMSALMLLAAGLLSFPAPIRHRLLGLLCLAPAVLLVNVARIAALYWTGAHWREHFTDAHVYVGQVVVIVVTAGLWFGWLSWTSRRPAASS